MLSNADLIKTPIIRLGDIARLPDRLERGTILNQTWQLVAFGGLASGDRHMVIARRRRDGRIAAISNHYWRRYADLSSMSDPSDRASYRERRRRRQVREITPASQRCWHAELLRRRDAVCEDLRRCAEADQPRLQRQRNRIDASLWRVRTMEAKRLAPLGHIEASGLSR